MLKNLVSHQFPKSLTSQISETVEKARQTAPVANARIAAKLWIGNDLLAEGCNSLKTHPFQKKYGRNEHCIHLHAEISVLVKAARMPIRLDSCHMTVARVKKTKPFGSLVPAMAKPCSGCQRALAAFGISKVYYTTDNEEFECL